MNVFYGTQIIRIEYASYLDASRMMRLKALARLQKVDEKPEIIEEDVQALERNHTYDEVLQGSPYHQCYIARVPLFKTALPLHPSDDSYMDAGFIELLHKRADYTKIGMIYSIRSGLPVGSALLGRAILDITANRPGVSAIHATASYLKSARFFGENGFDNFDPNKGEKEAQDVILLHDKFPDALTRIQAKNLRFCAPS